MIVSIMQPYFFPYLGYFALITHADVFVLLDRVQFIRHGWIERNRVLKPRDGWQYIRVPLVKASRETLIADMKIRDENWRDKIFAQLKHYEKHAPYYEDTIELLNKSFDIETDSITTLNRHSLRVVCDYLSIETPIEVFSHENWQIDVVNDSDEWALNITQAMGGSRYINPPGGREFFNPEKYRAAGIDLGFLSIHLNEYNQRRSVFQPGLSIIDVCMFNSPERIREYLDDYQLECV